MLNMLNIKNEKRKEIPIFFATDDNYIPFLDIAIRSLKENASRNYNYIIHVLNTGIKQENIDVIKLHEDNNFKIDFYDATNFIEPVKNKLQNVYHFTVEMYYRIFIEKMFPQYSKVLYLDCDIIVLGDISKLYNTPLGNNLVAGCTCRIVYDHPVFNQYAREALGLNPRNYFNSGVLLMNLEAFRYHNIVEKFIYLMNTYNFDLVDPDQAYLNFLCNGRAKILPNGWNKEAVPAPLEGDLNIVHYALYKKPWQYDDVLNGEYFWHYAKQSPFYDIILKQKAEFTDEKRAAKDKANVAIVEHAEKIIKAPNTMYNILVKNKQTEKPFSVDILSILDTFLSAGNLI